MFGNRRVYPEGVSPDPRTTWWTFKQKVGNLIHYCCWRSLLPHGPILDTIYIYILASRKIRKDCLNAAKLHQKWGHCTPLSLSHTEITILHAETRLFPHDPLFEVGGPVFQHFPCHTDYGNWDAMTASGLRRTLKLVEFAVDCYSYRRIWRGAKASHTGNHIPQCREKGNCSAFDHDYWKKHPEEAEYDGCAEYDAYVEAWWVEEIANPHHPLPPAI